MTPHEGKSKVPPGIGLLKEAVLRVYSVSATGLDLRCLKGQGKGTFLFLAPGGQELPMESLRPSMEVENGILVLRTFMN